MHHRNVGKLPKRAVNTISDIEIMATKIFFKVPMIDSHLWPESNLNGITQDPGHWTIILKKYEYKEAVKGSGIRTTCSSALEEGGLTSLGNCVRLIGSRTTRRVN